MNSSQCQFNQVSENGHRLVNEDQVQVLAGEKTVVDIAKAVFANMARRVGHAISIPIYFLLAVVQSIKLVGYLFLRDLNKLKSAGFHVLINFLEIAISTVNIISPRSCRVTVFRKIKPTFLGKPIDYFYFKIICDHIIKQQLYGRRYSESDIQARLNQYLNSNNTLITLSSSEIQ